MNHVNQIPNITTNIHHILHPFTKDKGLEPISTAARVGCVALLILMGCVTVGLLPIFYVVTATWKKRVYMSRQECPKLIENFWHTHIKAFKLRHFTHSIHHHHFTNEGITSSYPQYLKERIGSYQHTLEKLQKEHKLPIHLAKLFEQWYDQISNNQIKFCSTFSPQEWKKEFQAFVKDVLIEENKRLEKNNNQQPTEKKRPEEGKQLKENKPSHEGKKTEEEASLQQLIDLMEKLPFMTLMIDGGCPDITPAFWKRLNLEMFGTLDHFRTYVQANCKAWEKQEKLVDYLNGLLEQLKTNLLSNNNEVVINFPIKPENLHIESDYKLFSSNNLPDTLEFNKPVTLSNQELNKLKISITTGLSELEIYKDSKFKILTDKGNYRFSIVTREKLSPQEINDRKTHSDWIEKFNCHYLLNPS